MTQPMSHPNTQYQSPTHVIRSFWTLVTLFPVLVFALALLTPISWVAFNGWTLTGTNEESLGVRYFYSLRELYDPPTYLFLPQGQIIDLLNKAIQLLLTAIGLPPTQLFPRIDYFSYLSITTMQVFNVACFAWMASAISGLAGRLVAAIFWLTLIYSIDFSLVYTLMQPDYLAAEPGIALLATGAILRTAQGAPLTYGRLAGFAAMMALALAIKFTLVLFPAAAFGHALMLERSWSRSIIFAAAVGGIALATCFVIWFLNHGLNPTFLVRSLHDFAVFVLAGGGFPAQTDSWPKWLFIRIIDGPLLRSIVYALPVLSAVSLVFITSWRRAALILPLFVAAVLSSWVLYKRDYPNTLIESALMTLLIGWCVGSEVAVPLLPPQWRRYAATIIVGLAIPVTLSSYFIASGIAASSGRNTREQSFLPSPSSEGLRQLWLIPENADRPLSIHSAIMKGGHSTGGLNPDSPIMHGMFPDLTFRYHTFQRPIDLNNYDVIYFTFVGNIESGVVRMATYFNIDFSAWRCEVVAPIADRTLAKCRR